MFLKTDRNTYSKTKIFGFAMMLSVLTGCAAPTTQPPRTSHGEILQEERIQSELSK